jgi:cytochrome c-type biogenesis protein
VVIWLRKTAKINALADAAEAADATPALIANTAKQAKARFVKTATAVEGINELDKRLHGQKSWQMINDTMNKTYGKVRYVTLILLIALITALGYLGFRFYHVLPGASFSEYSLYFLALVAGIAAFFSPCSFSLLPAYISASYGNIRKGERKIWYILAAAIGVFSFSIILGIIVATIGKAASIATFGLAAASPDIYLIIFRIFVGAILILFGVMQFSNATMHNRFTDGIAQRFNLKRNGTLRFYMYGFGYTLAGIGCSGGILASLIFFALATGGLASVLIAFAIYAATMASLMAIVSVLSLNSSGVLIHKMKVSSPKIKKISGVVLIVVGLIIIYFAVNLQLYIKLFYP